MSKFTPEEEAEIRKLNSDIKVTTSDDKEPYIFISYKSDDRLMMLRIVHRLHKVYGLRVYYDKDFDVKNDLWVDQMEANISSAKCYGMMAFLTKKYYMSYATCMEMMISQTSSCCMKRQKETEKEYLPIVPVNLEPMPVFSDEELDMDTGLQQDNRDPNAEKRAFLDYYEELSRANRMGLTYYKPQRSSFPLKVKNCADIIQKIYDFVHINANKYYESNFDSFCNTIAENIHSSIHKGANSMSVFDEEKYNKAISSFTQTASAAPKEAGASENLTKKDSPAKEQKVFEPVPEKSEPVKKQENTNASNGEVPKKIGAYIKDCMKKLETSGYRFSKEMFADLFDRNMSRQMFSLNYAFFIDDPDKIKDRSGYNRYWKDAFKFNDKIVYISSQWLENGQHREKFDRWYASLQNIPKETSENTESAKNQENISDSSGEEPKKIGAYIKDCMKKLETSGYRFSKEMFADLFDRNMSRQMFSLNYAFFIDDPDKIKDRSGYNRYWKDAFKFNDKTVYISSQWLENGKQRENFDRWYASLNIPKKKELSETTDVNPIKKIGRGSSEDCTYSLYGKTYTENQSEMMWRVFEEVLKRHEDIVPQLPNYQGMNCVSFVHYELVKSKSDKPSYFRSARWLNFSTGGLCVGTTYDVMDKLGKIAKLLMICNEPFDVVSFEKYELPTVRLPILNE